MTTTRDMLARLPELAAEAFTCWGHPNPGERTDGVRTIPGPRVPIDVDTFDALRTDEGGLLADLSECVRIVWQEMDPDAKAEHPDPHDWHEATWSSECHLLTASHDWWQANLDQFDLGWVTDTIARTHRRLEQLTRQPKPARLRCPDCGDVLRVMEGGAYSYCDSGHEHPGPKRLAATWYGKPPVPAADIESELGVKAATLRQWKARGKIVPVRRDGLVDYWRPWDVVRLAYPGIEDTLSAGA